ncbi:ThiF family adenylyltransferase [Methanothermococcus sp.]|uniref:ThiF family adenylyltransferase n=1 Tax=Methanothermococcus sp. TaxID=2614238 RepID=UPI0025E0C1E8|nr:ThiF family adenylyltransferase [Methanothermococcus sp.]
MMIENVNELEKKLKPKGEVSIIGCGRLGIRVVFDLLEVHRGGAKKIYVFDNAKIDKNDIIHRKLGGKVGEYKVKFAERFFSDKVVGITENIDCNVDLIKGDVVIICIAGGNTAPIRNKIIEYCVKNGIKTIGTNGVFGIDEKVKVSDAKYANGPVQYMDIKKEGHIVVGTGRFIKDGEPITPYTLNEVSKKIVIECLKILNKK